MGIFSSAKPSVFDEVDPQLAVMKEEIGNREWWMSLKKTMIMAATGAVGAAGAAAL